MERQRHEHQKNDHDTRFTDAEIWSTFCLEKQASNIFTQKIFLDKQLEIDDAINSCGSAMIEKVDDFQIFSIKNLLHPADSYFKVSFLNRGSYNFLQL
ncbi:hypothetical protein R6Q57_001161 [Mikania cordata]